MANKKVSQLTSKPAVNLTDLFLIADPTSGQAFKTTISDLGTAIGSGVSSVNTLVGAVVLDTDDIQELASPTNRWFTDTRARAALSASSPLAYNSGTGVFSIAQANGSTNGFLSSTDWTTFNAKQAALSGTGFVKISGTTISYDNSTYLTTSAAASTYLALAGGTLTGALNGTSATFTGDLTLSATNPRLYLTDTDNNPDYFISNTDGTFTIYDVTNSTSKLTINGTTATLGANLTATSFIRSGGTSSQFLKADGSVDSSTYLTTGTAASTYLPLTGGTLTGNLNGTNITITNSLIAKGGTFNGGALAAGIVTIDGLSSNVLMNRTDTDNGTLISFLTNAVEMWHIGMRSGGTDNFVIYNSNLLANAVSVNISNSAVTLAGALNGTSAIFSSSVRSSGYYLTGMTSGSGALYYSSGSNRVTVANYNTGGIVLFEVNGGSTALTLNSNLSATFAGALSGTSATFNGILTINSGASASTTNFTNNGDFISNWVGNSTVQLFSIRNNSTTGVFLNTQNSAPLRFGVSTGATGGTIVNHFEIASTGAATFSGDLEVSNPSTTTGKFYISGTQASARRYLLENGITGVSNAGFQIRDVTGGFTPFSINATGGATFSSSVTVGTDLTVTGVANFNNEVRAGNYAGNSLNYIDGTNVALTGRRYRASQSRTNNDLGTVGLDLTNLQPTNNVYSPVISFSSMTSGNVQNCTYAAIWGQKISDEGSWAGGDLIFGTANPYGVSQRVKITQAGELTVLNNQSNGVAGTIFRAYAFSASSFFRLGNNTNNSLNIQLTRSDSATMFSVDGHSGAGYLGASAWTYGSDLRLKENVNYIEEGLSKILALKPAKFDYKKGLKNNIGWIAQDVRLVIPEAVDTISEDNDQLTLKSDFIVPYLVKAVQQLEAQIQTLKNK